MTEESTGDATPNEVSTENMTPEQQAAYEVASGGEYNPDESQAEPDRATEPAPEDGNQDQNDPAPGDGQPGKDDSEGTVDGTVDTSEASKDDKATEPDAQAEPEETDEEKAKREEALLNDLLGLSNTKPETVETVREKYQASSREAHALRDERSAIDQMLADKGVQLIQVGEGKYDLVANEKYMEDLDDKLIPDVFSSLSDAEKELAEDKPEEFAKLITKKAMAETQAMRPQANAREDQAVISDATREEVYNNFINAKLADGKTPRYPDASDEKVVDYMLKLYKDPSNEALVDAMQKSPEMYHIGMEALYNKVYRVIAPQKAIEADAKAQQKRKEEENKKGLSVSGESVTSTATDQNPTGRTVEQQAAYEIANSMRS